MGKVYAEAVGETQLSTDIFSYYAENAEAFLAGQTPHTQGWFGEGGQPAHRGSLRHRALELSVLPARPLRAINLMAGNTLVGKHAPSVPQCANLFEQSFRKAGAEPGVCTNLRLSNDQSSTVIADDRVRGITVTGSDRARLRGRE